MKATIDLPDEIYRRVKAKSALEGRAIREVAAELFQSYLEAPAPAPRTGAPATETGRGPQPPWFGLARKHIRAGVSHEWSEIRKGLERGWAEEATEPGTPPKTRTRR